MKSKINANRALVAEKSKFNKFLTLLAVLLFGIGNVWGDPTIPTTTLTLPTTGLGATWTGFDYTYAYYNDVDNGYVIFPPYAVRMSASTQTWYAVTGTTGSGTATWSSSGIFKGGAYYGACKTGETDPRYDSFKKNKSDLYHYYRVTNCTGVNIYFKSSASCSLSIKVYEVTGEPGSEVATEVTAAANSESYTSAASHTLANNSTLSASKNYVIEVHGTEGNKANIQFYEIAFYYPVYTITYDANGGSGTMSNSKNTISACTFDAPSTSQEFKEWNTQADGLGTGYDPGDAATSDLDLYAIWQTKVEKFTVKYMDGTTELGSETVEVGQHPTGSEIAAPTKDCYTFNAWSPALNTVSGTDGQVINVNATWTPVYASSFNFGTTTDLTKDNIATKLAASNIFCSVGTGGSYDAGGTTGYLGYKFKNNGDYVTFLVQDGYEAIVTYGYTESGWQVNGVDAGVTVKTQAYVNKTYQTDGSDLLLKLVNQSANSKTSVLTNIVIKVIAAGDDDATLSDLSVSGFTLSPAFASATEDYTITKEYGAADPVVGDVTATPSVTGATAAVVWDGTNHKFVVTVTAKDGITKKTYNITVNEAEAKRGLLTVPFSNGAKGAINAAGLEIRVPYIGASEPTIVLAGIEYQSGVAGATASMEAGKLRITGADSNYDDYTLTFVQLTPSALTLDELVTFDAVPSYAFAPYGWDSDKGVKFAKNTEDATPRISSGNTRVYFAIQACDEVQLTSGSGGARNVKIYVNGVLSSVNKTAASGSAIKLALDNTQANFIAIESNQTGGDGGFTKILVKALADNTLAYTDGAYTTGEAALDLSTLISTSNSDGAITYAVKTDGGTNASIAGNNFTATVAGTATITATQVASETIRQASVDFNVVVTAGATKYTVTFDAQGGSAVDPQEVTEGGSPIEPTAPTKDEYIFQGWSETTDGAVVDVTSFTINAPKIFYAIWVAEPAGIKLLDGSTVNHTNFITGVTADETVEFKGNTVNYAKFSGTVSGVNSVKDLTRVIAYNATTNQTKIRISAHNNSTSARNILVKGLVEGAAAAVDLATIALGNKEDKVSEWIEFNNAANRTIYIMVPSSAGDVYFTQVKVIEDGATPMKQAGEAGYSLNFDHGRFFGVKDLTAHFEGLDVEVKSSDCQPLNTSVVKLANSSISFDVVAPVTLTVTTNNNKTYYVTKGSAGTDNETAKTGATEFSLTAGTWYITGGSSNVEITNIAFSAPKCEEPAFNALDNSELCEGDPFEALDGTATVADAGVPTYQWYNADGDVEIDGATSATYTPSADGSYYVIATNHLAGYADNAKQSATVTVTHFASASITTAPVNVRETVGTDATLTVVAAGKNLGYAWYTCDDELGTNPVVIPGETAASLTITVTAGLNQYYKVLVSSDCGSASAVAKIEEWTELPQVNVSATTTWDWTKAATENIKLTDATTPAKNTECLMANINIGGKKPTNDATFNSQALLFYGENVRNIEGGRTYASVGHIKFTTTVSGMVEVEFSDNGSNNRRLNVNGNLSESSASKTDVKTFTAFVSAGDVTIMGVEEDGTGSNRYVRISKIIFTVKTAPDYIRSVTNNIGTLCVDHNVPAGGALGATFYQIAGKNDLGKLVFEEVTSLNAGEPYVFQSTTGGITLYYGEDVEASPVAVKGMIGSFTGEHVDIDDSNKTNIMYIANNKLWDCSDLVGSYLDVVANRAYIFNYAGIGAAPAHAPGKRYIVVGKDQATGFDQLEASETPMKLIVDGQLFILRGEKMYNANGQLVK